MGVTKPGQQTAIGDHGWLGTGHYIGTLAGEARGGIDP